ncbi:MULTISPECIES: hypothetical protein [unclassified Sphingobacterium]|uniref:hypothetical protein n=1 Tax=unclassified Sphingobacterium TaxID=2609468 RepID=UPI0025FE65AE|nr:MULTISPECIES: hypothetical protein [unclassified Sphingobacterium]
MERILYGKKILFIGQVFYTYHEQINETLHQLGGDITFYENKIFIEDPAISSSFVSRAKRLLVGDAKQRYNESILHEIANVHYDYLFVMGGFSITQSFLKSIKNNNPGIVMIYYTWDSLAVYDYSHLYSFFDRVLTFDRDDATGAVEYLPLFYTMTQSPLGTEQYTYDLLFIGGVGLHSINRLHALKCVADQADQMGLKYFFWLYYNKPTGMLKRFFHFIKYALDKSYRAFYRAVMSDGQFVKHTTLSTEEYSDLLSRSRCVVDIPVEGQVGLTIRTIESLSDGHRLLTTNSHIVKEDFFDSEMITILKSPDYCFDVNFVRSPIRNSIAIEHLRLDNWLTQIFSNSNAKR